MRGYTLHGHVILMSFVNSKILVTRPWWNFGLPGYKQGSHHLPSIVVCFFFYLKLVMYPQNLQTFIYTGLYQGFSLEF